MNRLALTLSLTLLPAPTFAQRNATIPDPDPEIERKSFIVAPGFEVTLWAADPLLAKPIQMNWDPQGRLWVATSEVYPQIEPGKAANDKLIILEDTKGTGKADKTTVFADGLLIPTGVAPGDGGAYVANSTEIVHLSASKPGGKADKSRVVLSGFGTEDTHHIIHTFRWGPDGCLYFNQSIYIHSHVETPTGVQRLNAGGIWRYRPETHDLTVFARGWINPWGHAFDKFGQSFVTDGAGGEGINHPIPGAYFMESKGPHAGRILHGLNPGSPKYCGLEILSGRHLPDDWQGDLITNDFRGHRVCRFKLQDDGSTFASREMPELIKSNHPAFRPIDVKVGPDGAIYIADWYNPIIQHGEVDFRDPRRDHTHGRIWRVSAKGRPLVPMPELVTATVPQLLDRLKDPEDWTREQARRVLKERGASAGLPELTKRVSALDPNNRAEDRFRLELMWLFQSFNTPAPELLGSLRLAKDSGVQAASCRITGSYHVPRTAIQALFDLNKLKAFNLSLADAVKGLGDFGWIVTEKPGNDSPPFAISYDSRLSETSGIESLRKKFVKSGGNEIPVGTFVVIQQVSSDLAGDDALSHLATATKDPSPRTRLEAVRALAQWKSVKAAEAALDALDKPTDRVLDYALWLTVRELEPYWLPKFVAGELDFGNDPKKVAFALQASGNPATIPALRKQLDSGKLNASQSAELWELLARIGGPDDLNSVLSQASKPDTSPLVRNRLVLAVHEAAKGRKVGRPREFDTLKSIAQSANDNDRPAVLTAFRLIGSWKVGELRSLLTERPNFKESDAERLESASAQFEGIAAYGDESAKRQLLSILQPSIPLPIQRAAVAALAGLDPERAAEPAVHLLGNTTDTHGLIPLFATFLSKKGGPQALTKAFAGKTLPPDVAKVGIRAAKASAQPSPELIAALTKAGNLAAAKPYPTEAEVKQLAADVANLGDPARGEAVYRKKDNQCLNCHALGGAGGRVGPDLTSIGASAQIDYLVESILNPQKAVKEGFHAVKVTTSGGKIVQGVPLKEANGELTLRDAEDTEVKMPLNQIEEKVPTRSLMADGLADPLTKQEILDLVRFLSELGKVGPYGPSTARVVRRWQAVDSGNVNTNKMRQARISAVADPAVEFLWLPTYSVTAGDLPLADLPRFTVWNNTAAQSVVRCQLDVTTAGKARLKLNDATGLTAYLGPNPVELKPSTDLDLPAGLQTLTLIVDRSLRTKDLRIDLEDVPGSPARVAIVHGK